jgi:hypothetical protein
MIDRDKYKCYVQEGATYHGVKEEADIIRTLPPGVYKSSVNPKTGTPYFEVMNITSDHIIQLPSSAYDQVIGQMHHFLQASVREKYKEVGHVYKRSVLLHGPAGTGKSVMSYKIAQDVVAMGGIVLFDPPVPVLSEILTALNGTQPDALVLVILEEFDKYFAAHDDYPEQINLVLDGGIQKNNTIYMATTNHLDRIAPKLLRPGRFSYLVNVGILSKAARVAYLKAKFMMLPEETRATIADLSKGYSVDELKELAVAHYCLDQDLSDIDKRIREAKRHQPEEKSSGLALNQQDEDAEEWAYTERRKSIGIGRR